MWIGWIGCSEGCGNSVLEGKPLVGRACVGGCAKMSVSFFMVDVNIWLCMSPGQLWLPKL